MLLNLHDVVFHRPCAIKASCVSNSPSLIVSYYSVDKIGFIIFSPVTSTLQLAATFVRLRDDPTGPDGEFRGTVLWSSPSVS